MRTPKFWQSRFPAALLLPLSGLFGAVSTVRRALYRSGASKSVRLPVPVVVVGNLSAGGAGKTPTVRYLAEALRQHGWQPGIISRGYGGSVDTVAEVDSAGPAGRFGDEPLLLAQTCQCPVFVGRNRAAAGLALLNSHPHVDVILSDDGLQHYRLARDIELVVIDGARGFDNGWLLPAGPLRELPERLASVDAIVVNGRAEAAIPAHANRFDMRLAPGEAYLLGSPDTRRALASFRGESIAAIAGIARPARFFATLRDAGLAFDEHPFPDHYDYQPHDVDSLGGKTILTTEKDAVKLARLQHNGSIWVIPVAAELTPDLGAWLHARLNALRNTDGRQTA
ncbi:MAG: tetraacyldisaccharide 4'-kinase [Burkholderiales bacterium]|nr:tetraacyldisaccharide 4'-kinase [Burkholderiales bacterium]